jgi:hypothetical protein
MIYFSLIIFIIISKTIQQNDTKANSCHRVVMGRKGSSNYPPSCMNCTIRYIDIMIQSDCSTSCECVMLMFENNLMFEEFFVKHHAAIEDLFPKPEYLRFLPTLRIYVGRNNITRITNEYINSIVNMDFVGLFIFLTFERLQNSEPITVDNHFFSLRFRRLTISIRCDDGLESIKYTIEGDNVSSVPYIEGKCSEIQFTQQVNTFTTIILTN